MVKNREGQFAIAKDFGVSTKPPAHELRFIAIDPGDVHVGVAVFTKLDDVWYCTWAHEFTPEAFLTWYVDGLRRGLWIKVVVESWKLFPEAAPIYVGSDMPTSRLIGAIEALALYIPEETGWFDAPITVHRQDPTIKTPTRGFLRRRKLRSVAKILGIPLDHASDAELHGYKYLIDRKSAIQNVTQQDAFWHGTRDLTPRHSIW